MAEVTVALILVVVLAGTQEVAVLVVLVLRAVAVVAGAAEGAAGDLLVMFMKQMVAVAV